VLPDGYQLRPLEADDAPALAAAYIRNREHLAPYDPVRDESFYTDEGMARVVEAQLRAIGLGQVDAWTLWHDGQVVGRVNINNIVRGVLQSANVGYWVDHEHTGRGLATAAVEHAVERARQLRLHRLEAGTLVDNEASQRVLLRCGFEPFGLAPKYLFIAGRWQDHRLYQRILHDEPTGNPVP
jgi:ribosomal-protein-alanine N-acetyltransferase